MEYTVVLNGGSPWGLRLQGGAPENQPLRISKVCQNSKAYVEGVEEGDIVRSINGKSTAGLRPDEATRLLRTANDSLVLELKRKGKAIAAAEFGSADSLHLGSWIQSQSDGELSTSTSDSQGSIIQVIDGVKLRIKSPSPCQSPVTLGCARSASVPVDCAARSMSVPLIWTPFGTAQMKSSKTYKQVSFSLPPASGPNETTGELERRTGRKPEGAEEGERARQVPGQSLCSRETRLLANLSPVSDSRCQSTADKRKVVDPMEAFNSSPDCSRQRTGLCESSPEAAAARQTRPSSAASMSSTHPPKPTPPPAPVRPSSSGHARTPVGTSIQNKPALQKPGINFDKRFSFDNSSNGPRTDRQGVVQRDRYGGTDGGQDVVKSSSFTYTPYEVKRGRSPAGPAANEGNPPTFLQGRTPGESDGQTKVKTEAEPQRLRRGSMERGVPANQTSWQKWEAQPTSRSSSRSGSLTSQDGFADPCSMNSSGSVARTSNSGCHSNRDNVIGHVGYISHVTKSEENQNIENSSPKTPESCSAGPKQFSSSPNITRSFQVFSDPPTFTNTAAPGGCGLRDASINKNLASRYAVSEPDKFIDNLTSLGHDLSKVKPAPPSENSPSSPSTFLNDLELRTNHTEPVPTGKILGSSVLTGKSSLQRSVQSPSRIRCELFATPRDAPKKLESIFEGTSFRAEAKLELRRNVSTDGLDLQKTGSTKPVHSKLTNMHTRPSPDRVVQRSGIMDQRPPTEDQRSLIADQRSPTELQRSPIKDQRLPTEDQRSPIKAPDKTGDNNHTQTSNAVSPTATMQIFATTNRTTQADYQSPIIGGQIGPPNGHHCPAGPAAGILPESSRSALDLPKSRPFNHTAISEVKPLRYRPVNFTPAHQTPVKQSPVKQTPVRQVGDGNSISPKSYRSASLGSNVTGVTGCRLATSGITQVETNGITQARENGITQPETNGVTRNDDPNLQRRSSLDAFSRYDDVPPDRYRVFNTVDPTLPVIEVTPPRPSSPVRTVSHLNESNHQTPVIQVNAGGTPSVIGKTHTSELDENDKSGSNICFQSCGKTTVTHERVRGTKQHDFTACNGGKTNSVEREKQFCETVREINSEFLRSIGNLDTFDRSGETKSANRETEVLKPEAETRFIEKPEVTNDAIVRNDNKFTPRLRISLGSSNTTSASSSVSSTLPEEIHRKYDCAPEVGNFARSSGGNSFSATSASLCSLDSVAVKREDAENQKMEDASISSRCHHPSANGNCASKKSVASGEERISKAFIKCRGIGPRDAETGMPTALRNWVEGDNRKQWYKQMFTAIHKKPDEYVRPSSAVPFSRRDENSDKDDGSSIEVESETEGDRRRRFHRKWKERSASPAMSVTNEYTRHRQTGAATYHNNSIRKTTSKAFDRQEQNGRSIESMFNRDLAAAAAAAAERRGSEGGGGGRGWNRVFSEDTNSRPSILSIDSEIAGRENGQERCSLSLRSRTPSVESRENEADRVLDNSLQRTQTDQLTTTPTRARALYSFRTRSDRELPFRKGDIIDLLVQVDKNWFRGQLGGRSGLVPVNYIEMIPSLVNGSEATSRDQLITGEGVAKYHFNGQSDLELSFRQGDVVTLLRQIDERWYEGRRGSRLGIVPASYVDVVRKPRTRPRSPGSSLATTSRSGSPSLSSPCGSSISSLSDDLRPSLPSDPTSPLGPTTAFNFDKTPPIYTTTSTSTTRNRPTCLSPLQKNSTKTDLDLELSRVLKPRPSPDGAAAAALKVNEVKVNLGDSEPTGQKFTNQPSTTATGNNHRSDTGSRKKTGNGSADDPFVYDRLNGDIEMYNTLTNEFLEQIRNGAAETTTSGLSCPSGKTTSGACSDEIQDLLTELREKSTATMVPYPVFRALFDYHSQNDDELDLVEGDVIYVMEKCDDGWFVGTSQRTDEFGTFPGNYVEELDAIDRR